MRWGGAMLGALMSLHAAQAGAEDSGRDPVDARVGAVVLIGPVQGTEGVREIYQDRVCHALGQALAARGYRHAVNRSGGRSLVTCSSPECSRAVLEHAGARFAIVPAVWARAEGRRELTLTLVGKSGRNVNAGTVLDRDLATTTATLVRLLLERNAQERATDATGAEWIARERHDAEEGRPGTVPEDRASPRPRFPHAWVAGPIALWAGAAATFVSVGAVAAMRDEAESLNRGAIAGWSVLGGAALAGGTTWWTIGHQRRNPRVREFAIRVSPSGFDMRGRF